MRQWTCPNCGVKNNGESCKNCDERLDVLTSLSQKQSKSPERIQMKLGWGILPAPYLPPGTASSPTEIASVYEEKAHQTRRQALRAIIEKNWDITIFKAFEAIKLKFKATMPRGTVFQELEEKYGIDSELITEIRELKVLRKRVMCDKEKSTEKLANAALTLMEKVFNSI